jgi:hypothetical protein
MFKSWTPLLGRKWTRIAELKPSDTFINAPYVEIRKSPSTDELETWFELRGYTEGEEGRRAKISSTSIPMFLEKWRSFFQKHSDFQPEAHPTGFFSTYEDHLLFRDRLWVDEKQRAISRLQIVQVASSTKTRINFEQHAGQIEIKDFPLWLDALADLHRPYLSSQPE